MIDLNEVFLIGKIHSFGENRKDGLFTLEVKRNYKDENGQFIFDYFPCKIWKGAMDVMISNCKVGDVIAIKARLEEDSDSKIIIIVEKLKFIYKDNRFQKN